MTVCVSSNQDGFLYVIPSNQDGDCESQYIALTVQDYDNMMGYTRLDPADISEAFTVGFSAVLFVGFLSTYAIKIAIKLVRLI